MRAESAGLTMLGGRPIVSRAGAMGLMQLMPATWAMMRDRLALGIYPHDPRDNILAGTCYLRAMYDRFGYPGLFAAYNAGPGRYAEHLATGDPLPPETRFYLATVAGETAAKPQLALPPNTPLFFVMRTSSMPTGAPAAPRPSSIFVTLSSGSIPRER
ncbi:lytic transglycosylase domain-containing protein [Hankyongella ginsenosidimutans]|uniref:lytic transglycosylase domain-containing protein n=1 Tax=Hankyongella ginsenosidimutans TaxID=1763828 RepID=UPI003CCC79FE